MNTYLQSITLLDIQNISLFSIAVSSFFLYAYHNLSLLYGINTLEVYYGINTATLYHIFSYVITIYTCIDIFANKPFDSIIHHLCVVGSSFYNIYYNMDPEYSFVFLYSMINTEISSVFYVLKYWLPEKSILYDINMLLFYFSFMKFRIYDYYYKIIQGNVPFDIVFQKYSHSDYLMSYILLVSCYGLYILNMYWWFVMNKILYKIITKIVNIDTDKLCQLLCSYLYFINIPLTIYVYYNDLQKKYIIDIIGVTSLGITSYIYHYGVYKRLNNSPNEVYYMPDEKNVFIFLIDSFCIRLRSFTSLMTNYYDSEYRVPILALSVTLHTISILGCIINLMVAFIHNRKNYETFYKFHNLILGIPMAYDVILICVNSTIDLRIPFLLINISIPLLFIIEPFYRLTHAGFHILLIAQNYYSCMSNIQ